MGLTLLTPIIKLDIAQVKDALLYNYVNYLWLYIIDINECASSAANNCQQVCNNNPGSYTCSCNTGYRLNSDVHTCSGNIAGNSIQCNPEK